jgi:glycosyltransferase involved in cell wall biosynthesis
MARGVPIVIDGLALGVLPEVASLRDRNPLIALVHHPLALETGLASGEAEKFRGSECAALAGMHAVITTSATTARLLTGDFGVPAEMVTIVVPGSERVLCARGTAEGIVSLLSVGIVVPRKGYDVLIAALAELRELPWRLTIVGDRTRDPREAARLDADIFRYRLGERIAVEGAVSAERLASLYAGADLFVLASRFEGYGMAFAQAIAHGVPVIGTTAGAIPEAVPVGAGVLVPPDDVPGLVAGLRRLIGDPDERARLAANARAAALPTWEDSGKIFARVIERLS